MPRPLAVFDEFDPAGKKAFENAVTRFSERNIVLPRFSQLRDPATIDSDVIEALEGVDRNSADPLNLFRVHWFNTSRQAAPAKTPDHIELPPEMTGTDARIVVALGNRFPMIGAHKVLAAYSCRRSSGNWAFRSNHQPSGMAIYWQLCKGWGSNLEDYGLSRSCCLT